jgi:4-hydroxyphenylacetate 3-monooxygenase
MMNTTRGKKYLDSLKDGRNVWLNGSIVKDVAVNPAFTGTLSTIERLFNMLDQPDVQHFVGFQPPSSDKYAHSSFLVPRNQDDLRKRSIAFKYWADETHGVMSRLSEYARSLVTGWYAAKDQLAQLDPQFAYKITDYYEKARDNDLFLANALLDPQVDRSKGLEDFDAADRVLHIVKETEDGLIVRGAKMIATAAPYAHDFLIFPFHKVQEEHAKHAHALIVPANSPGLHIVCREPFTSDREQDHLLSAFYDEMDAVLFFDDVLVPWERVLIHGNAEAVWKFRMNQTANSLAFHQTVVRLLSKLEFVTGVAIAVAEAIGVTGYLHIQEKLGELISQVETVHALLVASEAQAEIDDTGTCIPALKPIDTARILGSRFYPRAIEILQQIGAGGFIQVPSTLEEINGPISELMQKYFAGATVGAEEKVKLFKLAWDLFGSQLGSRHELYERYYAGDPIRALANLYTNTEKQRYTESVWELLRSESHVKNLSR